MPGTKVLIVGGGIAGLATAAGLQRAGIACEIVERAPQWAPVGAGIVLGVNAMRVMRKLGLAEGVAARGTRLGAGSITDETGRALGSTDFQLLEPEFGPTIAIHRAALHEVLLSAAAEVPIALGTSVDALDPRSDGTVVRLTDGREERYDLVVGADGVRSRVRELAFGDRPLDYSGYTCWRLVVKVTAEQPQLREMWAPGRRFGLVPIDAERVYCFAVANAPRGETDPEQGRLERFRERFAVFGGQVPAVLDALERPEELIHNDLEELPPGPWFTGRVVLVGDAAHALTPNMGQGAAMALEDSMVLVELLASGQSIDEALPALVARREKRVRWVQDQSRRIGRMGQLERPWLCGLRNALLRLVPDSATTRSLRRMAEQAI